MESTVNMRDVPLLYSGFKFVFFFFKLPFVIGAHEEYWDNYAFAYNFSVAHSLCSSIQHA